MCKDRVLSYRLHRLNRVCMSKHYAIYWALLFVQQQSRHCYPLCKDSVSTLSTRSSGCFGNCATSVPPPWGREACYILLDISPISVPGNITDATAPLWNLTLNQELGNDVCAFLFQAVLFLWQDKWSQTVVVKLYLKAWCSFNRSVKTEKIIVTWLWIGHTHLMHCHLIGDLAHVCN